MSRLCETTCCKWLETIAAKLMVDLPCNDDVDDDAVIVGVFHSDITRHHCLNGGPPFRNFDMDNHQSTMVSMSSEFRGTLAEITWLYCYHRPTVDCRVGCL